MLMVQTWIIFCQSILGEDIYNENKANRLRDLIIYGVEYCELAVPDDPFLFCH